VFDPRTDQPDEIGHIEGIAAGDESIAGGQRQEQGIDSFVDVGLGQTLRLNAQLERWRRLTLGQAIDPIVIENIGDI
jgi:hypothetical protein